MSFVQKSIEVDVPVSVAYNQWTQFEEFPRFMDGVESVSQLSDKRVHWVARVGGRQKEWDADITEQTPDRRISWMSTSGAKNAGSVGFADLGPDRTQVTLRLEAEPEGIVEQAGTAVGVLDRTVEGDLERFKDFIESRGSETGGWRGEVRQGETVSRDG